MWLEAAFKTIVGRTKKFAWDDRASVSVDFVVAIPILLAVLVFTSEYGRVLQMRTVLDNAVADAARYLARAPKDDATDQFPPDVIAIAEQIILSRVNVEHIAIGAPVVEEVPSNSTIPYETVSLTVSIGVATPAISVIALASYGENAPTITAQDPSGAAYEIAYRDIEGFILTSTDKARHFGQ